MKKKNLWRLLTIMMVAMLSVSFASCGSDDDDEGSSSGLSASNLVGEWVVIADDDGNSDVGEIWGFNADGTFYGDNSDIYTAWKIVDGKLQMTRDDGRTEAYTASIKDGKLYLSYDGENTVLEKVNQKE